MTRTGQAKAARGTQNRNAANGERITGRGAPTGERAMEAQPTIMAATKHRSRPVARFAAALLAATLLAGLAPAAGPGGGTARAFDVGVNGGSGTARPMTLGLNKCVVIDLPADAHDILVADPEVADAVVRSSRRIYLFGKSVGQTNIFVFGRSGEQIAAMDLDVERDISQLVATIERLVPGSSVQAEMINDNVVLTGTVPTPAAAATAVQLGEVFAVGGERADASAAQQVSVLQAFQPRTSRVVNLLKVIGEDQVHLKVTVAEVQRSVVKQLGIDSNFRRSMSDGLSYVGFSRGEQFLRPVQPNKGLNALLSGLGDYSLSADLRALEQTGVMRTLAEPSMTAISGELAQFKVGGQMPILKEGSCEADENGNIQRAYNFENKDVGIAMAFTPVVLTSGRISLKVRTEVSEPTASGMQTGLCGNLVGIRKRLADTTVELPSGGAMVIGGLVQDDVRQVVSGLPGLQRIPVLGTLFRSKEFVRNETELVIILTPYLVRPVAASQLTRPDKNFAPTGDGAGHLLGRINRVYGTKSGKLPEGRYVGSIGFILD